MVLDLRGKKVVVIGGKQSVGAAIFEAVAREGADVVIWLRKCINGVDETKASPITQLDVPRSKIFGIKTHRIGKERREAICQALNQNRNKTYILCNLISIIPTTTTPKRPQNHRN